MLKRFREELGASTNAGQCRFIALLTNTLNASAPGHWSNAVFVACIIMPDGLRLGG